MDAWWNDLSAPVIALLALCGLLLLPRTLRYVFMGGVALLLVVLAVGNIQPLLVLAAVVGLIALVIKHPVGLLAAGFLLLVAVTMPSWLLGVLVLTTLAGLISLQWGSRT